MAILRESARAGVRAIDAAADLHTQPETAFELLCAVKKWPLWLGFVRSAELIDAKSPLCHGSEIRLRSAIPGQNEELYEVDRFIPNHQISLVGAYSVRRRLDFRIERKSSRAKLHARLEYPAYGGRLGGVYDALRTARALAGQFQEAVEQFKHLAEYDTAKDALLADF